MSLLQQLRRSRNISSLDYYQSLIKNNQRTEIKDDIVTDDVRTSRHYDIKVIMDNKKKLVEKLARTRIDVKRAMEEEMKTEPEKNTRILTTKTMDGMISGLHDSKNIKKFITDNSDNFKELEINEQRTLFKLFLNAL